MTRQLFESAATELVEAIDVLSKSQLRLPAMLILYTGIDIMASLDRSESSAEVKSSDFVKWADRYLLPGTHLACNAEDLYAARCGLLHTYIAESRRSRKGKARQIWYSWGDASADELQAIIDVADVPPAVAVHVDDLSAAFRLGIERFKQSTLDDSERANRVYDRAGNFFGNLPALRRVGDGA
jgi:hypothetical protein